MAFDGPDLLGERGQYRRLVAGACADLEHPVGGGEAEQFGHAGHDVGLGDGLAQPDGQGGVVVGRVALGGRDKQMAGNALHGSQHPLVGEAAGTQLVLDHAVTEVGEVGLVEF